MYVVLQAVSTFNANPKCIDSTLNQIDPFYFQQLVRGGPVISFLEGTNWQIFRVLNVI